MLSPDGLLRAADIARDALAPHVDDDWSVRAGPLDWTVQETVAHMVGALAKYTLYLASGSERFIALSCVQWPDATQRELLESIGAVAQGLVTVASAVPVDRQAFHADGLLTSSGFLARGCVELLVHTDDALRGWETSLPPPPADLLSAVLRAGFPAPARPGPLPAETLWRTLLEMTGRPEAGRLV